MTLHRFEYGSINEFCNAPFVNHRNELNCGSNLICGQTVLHKSGGSGWYGAAPAIAQQRVIKGWPEGADKIKKALEALQITVPMSVRRRLQRTDQGDELDIHAVNRGDLSHAWTARHRRRSRSKLQVRLVLQLNLLARTDAEELFWRGAAAVRFADLLTEAGYSVEIVGAVASKKVSGFASNDTVLATFPVKPADAPLDIAALTGVVANAGFHRIYGFRWYYAVAPDLHGHPGAATSDAEGTVFTEANLEADGVKTFRVPYGVLNQSSAEAWLRSAVEALDEQPIEVQ